MKAMTVEQEAVDGFLFCAYKIYSCSLTTLYLKCPCHMTCYGVTIGVSILVVIPETLSSLSSFPVHMPNPSSVEKPLRTQLPLIIVYTLSHPLLFTLCHSRSNVPQSAIMNTIYKY